MHTVPRVREWSNLFSQSIRPYLHPSTRFSFNHGPIVVSMNQAVVYRGKVHLNSMFMFKSNY